MITRIFILDDSLVFEKNDRRYFGRIQKFTDSLEFRDNQGIERHAVC